MKTIYLDYNATTPVAPTVYQAMQPFFAEHYGNPSSTHALGRACEEAIEDARGQVAQLIGADSEEIVFTSGGTESNNMAIKGVMLKAGFGGEGHLIISAIEHPAVAEPARYLESLGFDVSVVPCNGQGVVEADAVEKALRPDTLLVSIMQANNETGVVQPIREISQLCRANQALLHVDAAQAIGKIRSHVDELDVDLLTIAGHKVYAPKGVGALYVRRGVALEPVTHGAGHEAGLRPGTENVPYIVGLGKAAVLAQKGEDDEVNRMASLRDRLYDRLFNGVGNELRINGGKAQRLPNTLSVSFPGVIGTELLKRAPEVAASTGAACHSGSVVASATLNAMGLPPERAQGTVRLSVGWYTSEENIDRAADLLLSAYESLK